MNISLPNLVPRGSVPYTQSQKPNPIDERAYYISYRDFDRQTRPIEHRIELQGDREWQFFSPQYYFTTEQQSVRFQCAARQKQLLAVFGTTEIRKKSEPKQVSVGVQLKLWRSPDEQKTTFTFLAHMDGIDPKKHYEFNISWFKQEVQRLEDGRVLVLTFNTPREERRRSSAHQTNAAFPFFSKRKDKLKTTKDPDSYPEDSSPGRSSTTLESCASDSSHTLPDGPREVTQKGFLSWRELKISFLTCKGW
jgi:hypothetical protein